MTPEKLELLRKWVQAECRQVYYKLELEDKVYEDINDKWNQDEKSVLLPLWNDICKQEADAAFFKVVMAFCGID